MSNKVSEASRTPRIAQTTTQVTYCKIFEGGKCSS
jgi:hypothetical protein